MSSVDKNATTQLIEAFTTSSNHRQKQDSVQAGFVDLGRIDYHAAHRLQVQLVEQRRSGELSTDLFLLVEHPQVFTLGRRGGLEHLTVSKAFLQKKGVDLIHIERGGDITYHGPGQLVLYPIFNLRRARLSVKDYVFGLEEIMLRTADSFGITAVRNPRNHGIWVGDSKLGSVGIAVRHSIAFHGLALNVNNDLHPFGWINPCGLANTRMTSLAQENGNDLDLSVVKTQLRSHAAAIFAVDLESTLSHPAFITGSNPKSKNE